MKQLRYDRYVLSSKEKIMYGLIYLALDAGVSYLFYRSIVAFLVLLVGMKPYFGLVMKRLLDRQQKELEMEFREAIMAVSASLSAGYSVENAFKEAVGDLINMYGTEAVIVCEFVNLAGRLSANETLESILADLADRSGLQDIQDFADVFITAKRSGGDLENIIRRTAYHIGDKVDVKRDIETVMSSKKTEQGVMNVIPFIIILYLNITSPGFLDPLYGNVSGVLIMTLCIVMYFAALYLSRKMMEIEV